MKPLQLLLLLFITALLNACALLTEDLKTPQISLVNIKPVKLGFSEQRFAVRLRVKNPNSVDLPIRGMNYKLQLNDQDFAEGSNDQAVTIPANGESQFDIDVTAGLGKVLKHLRAFQRGPIAYKLNGDVGLASSALRIPFEYAGDIKIKF